MKKWEKELKKRSYSLEGNGRILDDVDAQQVGRIAEIDSHNEALVLAEKIVLKERFIGNNMTTNNLLTKIIREIQKLKK